jgi:hypothetical protein
MSGLSPVALGVEQEIRNYFLHKDVTYAAA